MISSHPGVVEAAIAAAWRDVLQIDAIGLTENFFDRGGDSHRMLQVRELLRSRLDINVSMIDLFEYPTIGALARHLRRGFAGDGRSGGDAYGERRRRAFAARAASRRSGSQQ